MNNIGNDNTATYDAAVYNAAVPAFFRMLNTMDRWLDMAEVHAVNKGSTCSRCSIRFRWRPPVKREITVQTGPEERMTFSGEDYLHKFSLPQFFFHATMTYAILRRSSPLRQGGLVLGKRDFVGTLAWVERATSLIDSGVGP